MNASRGQTLPLVAVAAALLVGVTGFAVDTGYHQYQQRLQQTATDSAALAGAAELAANDWQAAAKQDARNNGYTDNTTGGVCDATVGRVCVIVNNPPVAPDRYAGNAHAVEVQITVYHPTFFEKVFQFNKVPVTTKAVATLQPESSNNCLYVLNGQANFNGQGTPGAAINAPNCGLQFNQAANFHSASVDAYAINCAAACSGGTYTQATPQPAAPASDPCTYITYCAYLVANPPPCSQTPAVPTVTNGQPVTLQPGCYNGNNGSNFSKLKNASTVTFTCGLYVIDGVTLSINTNPNVTPINVNSTCATGTPGVTFYVENNGSAVGSVVMNNDNIALTAPTSGDYSAYGAGEQNVLIYNAGTGNITMQSASCANGCSSFFSGMIYTPNSTLNYNQYSTTNTGAVLIIVGTLNANGGINSIIGPGGQGPYTIQVPVLGE